MTDRQNGCYIRGGCIEALAESNGDTRTIHGVAIREGSVTFGQSKEHTRWPAPALQAAEPMLAGVSVIDGHPDSPTASDKIGEVTDARYIDGLGLAFEAEVTEAMADKASRGWVDASPYLYRTLSDPDNEGVRDATEILGIRDLGIVTDGAGEGVGIESGPSPDIAAEPNAAEALASAFDIQDTDMTENIDELKERIESIEQENEALETERDSLQAENEDMRSVFAEGLSESSPFDADTIAERFTFSEISDTLEAEGKDPESVIVEPRSGGGSESDAGGVEALSSAEKEQLEALETRKDLFSRRGMDSHVEKIEAEITQLTN